MPTDGLIQRLGQFLAQTLPISPALAAVLALFITFGVIVSLASIPLLFFGQHHHEKQE